MKPVKDFPGWNYDNGTFVNTDVATYQSYLQKKKAIQTRDVQIQEKFNNIDIEIDGINNKLDLILTLLQSK